jgi:protein-S-isoprenylcysteine O-methyltransferase Ste14
MSRPVELRRTLTHDCRARASGTDNKEHSMADRKKRKHWAFRWRGANGMLFMTPFVVLVILSAPRVREGSWGGLALDDLGWVLFMGGVAVRFWATMYVGGRKSREVVCDGPYSMCRHPLYLGTALLLLAVAAFLKSATCLLGVALAISAYRLLTVPAEEEALRQKLGPGYEAYAACTPRFLPRRPRPRTPNFVSVKVKSLSIEFRRTMVWLGFPLGLELVNRFRELPWWPHLFRLP